MPERIYALLLQLYPARFQKRFGKEALQLLRDRARDERGPVARLRLWLDVLSDLFVSLPTAYHTAWTPAVVPQAQRPGDGTPSFRSLEAEAIGVRSMLCGGVAALVAYGSILVLIGHGRGSLPLYAAGLPQATQSPETDRRAPTISLSFWPANPAPSSVVDLLVTVSAPGGAIPTGQVRFVDGIEVLKLADLQVGAVRVTARLSETPKHLIRATYLGDARYSPASSVAAGR